ncbi:MAG: enoyl-CoA hydratase/isomerase family protein [Propionibacteriaceae bacterium]|nr:enoyl-CoA hydratase/isomerase family protein [Propionibacteriaceae bacterium]
MTELPTHPGLRTHRDGDTLTVTLANPEKRNPQTPTLWLALEQIATGLDPAIRLVVLNAEGRDFSTGLDRGMLSPDGMVGEPRVLSVAANRGLGETSELIRGFQRAFTAWGEVSAIVLAAVQGHAIGAGFQLALAADLRIVTTDVRLAMREPSLGLVPDLGGTLPLVHALGYSRALEICVTSRFIGAQEAVAYGLATLAVPNEDLEKVTAEVAGAILEIPDAALRETKQLLRAAVHNGAEEQLRAEREAQARLLVGVVGKHLEQRPHDHGGHDHDHGDRGHSH